VLAKMTSIENSTPVTSVGWSLPSIRRTDEITDVGGRARYPTLPRLWILAGVLRAESKWSADSRLPRILRSIQ